MSAHKLFPSQLPNEAIVLIVREHWFPLFAKFLAIALLSFLPFIVKQLLFNMEFIEITSTVTVIYNSLTIIYYLVLFIALFIVFVLYYLNLHIVSENRIVDIDQIGLLSHEISELNIETIEDVTGHTTGLFGNLLDYGTVYVQTAGGTERFEFENVPNPASIAGIILDLFEKHGGTAGGGTGGAVHIKPKTNQ